MYGMKWVLATLFGGTALFYGLDTGKYWEAFFAFLGSIGLVLAIDAEIKATVALKAL